MLTVTSRKIQSLVPERLLSLFLLLLIFLPTFLSFFFPSSFLFLFFITF